MFWNEFILPNGMILVKTRLIFSEKRLSCRTQSFYEKIQRKINVLS